MIGSQNNLPLPFLRPRAPSRRLVPRARRGVAAVLAMLYLVLFSILALGFYAATTTAVQISGNEKRGSSAFLAAESGHLDRDIAEAMRRHGVEVTTTTEAGLRTRDDAG